MKDLLLKLENRLKSPLPGEKAQLLMGSDIRMKELKWVPENESTRHSGVLILLYPNNGSLFSVLIQRPKYDGVHGGQMALPGGKIEKHDPDIVYTALRETEEEIGINKDEIRTIGCLSRLYIPPSNYVIFPTVGYIEGHPEFKKSPEEVDEIVEYDIMSLLDPTIKKTTEITISKQHTFSAPYFDIRGKIVWGATGMVLSEFREILIEISNS